MDVEQAQQRFDIKQGEAKILKFYYNDGAEEPSQIDVSAATLSFRVKKKKSDVTAVLEKEDGDFDKTEGADGIALLSLSKDETKVLPSGSYKAEIRAEFDAQNIDKSIDIDFVVHRAIQKDT